MKKIKTLLFLFLVASIVVSCGSPDTKDNTGQIKQQAQAIYEWEHIFVKDDQCEHEEAYQCAHVMLDFPVFKEAKMSRANLFINHFIADVIGYGDAESDALVDLDEVAHELIKDFQGFKSPALGSPQLWHVRLKSKFTCEKDDLVCLLIVSESFMGGAHASMNKRFMTFNLNRGEVVDLIDRIEDKTAFTKLAEQKFRKMRRLEADADLNASGYQFPNNQFVLPANIGIDDKGYLLHYNAYEIAPYAKGPTDIRIGFEELK